MELDPETVNAELVEVGLPSSLDDLTNPTEDYVLNLLTQFMVKFNIDLSTIKRANFKQLSLGLAEDNPEMLALVNISEAMAGICNEIFLKDFSLTDITSPVPKKNRRIAKFLGNFVLYTNNKMVEIEDRLESSRLKIEELNNLRLERNTLTEAQNAMALENSKKLALKEQLLIELEQLKARKKHRRARTEELEAELKAADVEKLRVEQLHGKLTAKAMKMHKKTEELESKIVRSPKRFEASLQEVMEQKKFYIEKREVMLEQLRSKKPAIEKIESYLSIVREHHAKFPELTETFKRLTESNKEIEEASKRLADMRSNVEQEAMMYAQDNEQASNADLEKAKEQCEQSLANFRKKHTELLNEKKVLEKALEVAMIRKQEILSQIDKTRASAKQREDDTASFIKNCQELYDAEIKKEREMRNIFESNEEHKN